VYAKIGNSGSEIRRYFCGHCGSYIFSRQDRLDRKLIFRPVYVETDGDLVDRKATDDTPVYVKIGQSSPVAGFMAELIITRTVPCWKYTTPERLSVCERYGGMGETCRRRSGQRDPVDSLRVNDCIQDSKSSQVQSRCLFILSFHLLYKNCPCLSSLYGTKPTDTCANSWKPFSPSPLPLSRSPPSSASSLHPQYPSLARKPSFSLQSCQ